MCIIKEKYIVGAKMDNGTERKGLRIHKSWQMTFVMLFIIVIGLGLYNGANSVFLKPICEDLGFTRGEYSLMRTIITLVSVFFIPVIGKLLKTIGARKVLLISSLGIGLLVMTYGFLSHLWQFYLVAALIGIFNNGLSMYVAGQYINIWFTDSKGMATAIAYCGSGLGTSIFSPLCASLIASIGWRNTFIYTSLAGLAALIVLILFFLKDTPESAGVEKYVKTGAKGKELLVRKVPDKFYTIQMIRKMPVFYVLIICYVGMSFFNVAPYYHMTAFFSDLGYSAMTATTFNSYFQIVLTIAKLLLGFMFDKVNKKITSILMCVMMIMSPLTAILAFKGLTPLVFCTMHGFVGATYTVAMNAIISDVFGQAAFGNVLSIFTIITTIGGAAASPFMGFIFDSSGSYLMSFVIFLVMAVISSLCMLYACWKKEDTNAIPL